MCKNNKGYNVFMTSIIKQCIKIREEQGMSVDIFCRRLGISEWYYKRLLDGDLLDVHIDLLVKMASVLGRKAVVKFKD